MDQKEDIDVTLAKIEQVMPKYCVPRKLATEELQSLDEGSEKQNDWRSLLFELSPAVRSFWEELADIPDKKMEKKQKAALLKAFVCNYQWSCSDWRDRRDNPASRAMMESLLWGYYRNEELQKAFAIREDGQAVDAKGAVVSVGTFPHEKYQIGLVHPEELMQSEREYWKKYAKKKKWKQPFSQLNIPAYERPYDLTAFSGKQTTQLFMVTAAGKWGLYQGSDKNQYMSYHMADLLHGYGAQLVFDGIWRGPEYGPEIIIMEKVIFYRFRHFLLWDHVPESLVCSPEDLPARFVSTALAAFWGIIGKGVKKE